MIIDADRREQRLQSARGDRARPGPGRWSTRKSALVRAATAASSSWASSSCSGVIRLRNRALSTWRAAMYATYPAVVSGLPMRLTRMLRVAQAPRPSSARSSPSRASTCRPGGVSVSTLNAQPQRVDQARVDRAERVHHLVRGSRPGPARPSAGRRGWTTPSRARSTRSVSASPPSARRSATRSSTSAALLHQFGALDPAEQEPDRQDAFLLEVLDEAADPAGEPDLVQRCRRRAARRPPGRAPRAPRGRPC